MYEELIKCNNIIIFLIKFLYNYFIYIFYIGIIKMALEIIKTLNYSGVFSGFVLSFLYLVFGSNFWKVSFEYFVGLFCDDFFGDFNFMCDISFFSDISYNR